MHSFQLPYNGAIEICRMSYATCKNRHAPIVPQWHTACFPLINNIVICFSNCITITASHTAWSFRNLSEHHYHTHTLYVGIPHCITIIGSHSAYWYLSLHHYYCLTTCWCLLLFYNRYLTHCMLVSLTSLLSLFHTLHVGISQCTVSYLENHPSEAVIWNDWMCYSEISSRTFLQYKYIQYKSTNTSKNFRYISCIIILYFHN